MNKVLYINKIGFNNEKETNSLCKLNTAFACFVLKRL